MDLNSTFRDCLEYVDLYKQFYSPNGAQVSPDPKSINRLIELYNRFSVLSTGHQEDLTEIKELQADLQAQNYDLHSRIKDLEDFLGLKLMYKQINTGF